MTTTPPAITIPRHEGESARAYAARVEYVTAGPGRSIDKVGQQRGNKKATPSGLITRWSSTYGWVKSAEQYDNTLATLHAQQAGQRYLEELEDHRARYQKAGKDLYATATGLLGQCVRAIRGEAIKGEDGKTYLIPAMELTPATLSTVLRALTTAADLEAHALRLGELLPKLSHDVHDPE